MKLVTMMFLCATTAAGASAGEIIVERMHGEVMVRKGVEEEWQPVGKGARVRPHDSMKTGEGAGASLLVMADDGGRDMRIDMPGAVILDLSDLRTLTKEELLLKLTMERVKAAPYEWKPDELRIPKTTVVHGKETAAAGDGAAAERESGMQQMNGAKLLYEHGFFSSCALKGLSLLGRFPSLRESFDNRMLVAESLERSDLPGEALDEYIAMESMSGLTSHQRSTVRKKIAGIKASR